MAKPHGGEDSPGKHRPLPSIDMALLPHELRALRMKQALLGVAALAVVSIVVVLSLTRGELPTLVRGAKETKDELRPAAGGDLPAIAASAAAGGSAAPKPAAVIAAPVPEPAVLPPDSSEVAAAGGLGDNGVNAAAAAPKPVAVPVASGSLARVSKPFGKARGFRDALVNAGATGAEADALITGLDKIVDFRHGQPEHELIFERDAAGVLKRFEYRASVTERYSAERKPDGSYKGARIQVDVERRRITKGGYVSDSLGSALEGLGLKNSLAGVFVEAFEGKIDFKKDARQGDSFRVIMEEEYVEGQLLGYGKIQAIQYSGARAGEATAYWYEPDGETGDFYDEHGRALHGGWLRTPLRYDHISSPYNLRRKHPILKRIVPHQGIDYAASPGTTVWAAADGVVTFSGPRGANGNLVSLKHNNGYETHYAHLLHVAHGVTRGAKVKQRQPIGQVGSTGRSTGPHLHFALKRNGRFLDPATQLNGPGKLLAEGHQAKFKRQVGQLKRDLGAIVLAAAPAPSGEATPPVEETSDEGDDL